ncbi:MULTISPECIES: LysE family translocator [Bradyrhizobium]|uniref:LysE family translocator n=1 Tax=Bradyrhizobium brasilense TaxID=1419277 RepID=A0ABY8JHB7_9BRAD|nr:MULTISPECIES: LysE family translocator [Bradyrhizobium]MCP1912210.1 threonine/homoserine/homoserine lactone efflux protein [Bradyrhizobium elkanii]MCC8949913.1 LysE family translocator [Bradyrhizobium brasilense]MCP1829820.1 threonine/homoserine/homoserine lactone efflux protein [Bradyrhizobium sp. USDA 4545]MCP1848467.1 threonine/homoserine/homoserine lactone efflux protein [Bradyrhizobium sp. USDA 4541]MCP1922929.1 threonine/homoserine/homoserine lactone efflux protein [Bradyrhizobium sp.
MELYLAFAITTATFALIPGPAMLYAAARTLAGGRRAGLMASLGLHLGGYVHVVAAAAGLALLFHAVPPLFMAMKLAGAAYLVWLGLSLFRDRDNAKRPTLAPLSAERAFAQSIVVEVLNPKTAIFFLAFLPQFVDASASLPVWAQLFLLGTAVNLTFSAVDIVCVFFASAVMSKLQRSKRSRRIMQRIGGSILVALGARLAFQDR